MPSNRALKMSYGGLESESSTIINDWVRTGNTLWGIFTDIFNLLITFTVFVCIYFQIYRYVA